MDEHEAEEIGHADVAVVDARWQVRLSGEISLEMRPRFDGVAVQVASEPLPVDVDLAAVTFMDSSGINIFLAAHRALSEAGGWLRLAAAGESVLRTLQIVGIDEIINCHPTLPDALNG